MFRNWSNTWLDCCHVIGWETWYRLMMPLCVGVEWCCKLAGGWSSDHSSAASEITIVVLSAVDTHSSRLWVFYHLHWNNTWQRLIRCTHRPPLPHCSRHRCRSLSRTVCTLWWWWISMVISCWLSEVMNHFHADLKFTEHFDSLGWKAAYRLFAYKLRENKSLKRVKRV